MCGNVKKGSDRWNKVITNRERLENAKAVPEADQAKRIKFDMKDGKERKF